MAVPLSSVLLIGGLAPSAQAQTARPEAVPKIEPQRFAPEIADFDKEDKAAPASKDAIVVTGASSIKRWHPIRRGQPPLEPEGLQDMVRRGQQAPDSG